MAEMDKTARIKAARASASTQLDLGPILIALAVVLVTFGKC